MKIGLYKRSIAEEAEEQLKQLCSVLTENGFELVEIGDKLPEEALDFVFSIGGDGTLLSSVHLIGRSGIPVLGVNFGHLGFLTTIGRSDFHRFADDLAQSRYGIEERSLLHVEVENEGNTWETFVLNEVSLHRNEEAALLRTEVYVDKEYVSTYVGDGIIAATPTGSTAYSLSCGGPILTPNSNCFVLTPIGVHTLTLRPIVVPDGSHIMLLPNAGEQQFYLGTDSNVKRLSGDARIWLSREDFSIRLVRMNDQNFFTAIRSKLSWGC